MSEVILLGQADCTWCDRAEAVLARLGSELGFGVRKLDVGCDQGRRLAEEHRLAFLPGVICDGRLVGYGRVSERALRRRLASLIAGADPC